MGDTFKLGVVGNPVAHSKSPEIHELFAKEFKINLVYEKIEVPLGEFEQTVDQLIDDGYLGINVTIPFKVDAFRYATKCTPNVRQSRAANTLKFERNTVLAENTDGSGFVRDVKERLGFNIQGKTILILGAGGGVRGILPSLLDEKPKSVSVANRSVNRAQELADEFGIQSILYDETGAEQYDMIINATPASLQNKVPLIGPETFEGSQLAYDLVYKAEPTPFMIMAKEGGAEQTSDGLGMLVEQAADSFEFWFGQRPKTESVYKKIRSIITKQD